MDLFCVILLLFFDSCHYLDHYSYISIIIIIVLENTFCDIIS